MIEKYQILKRLKEAESALNYGLNVFGDHLAKREKYKSIDGIQAIHFYLMQKHHWLPASVKSMSDDDLRFCLTEEMANWTWPADAR
ncbi:MAG: hypothetical protein J0I79_26635 [Mesorhizobium sp.]|uniref:hypothetical protein n=1 Tax=Mesorhizobium sp. TaxID=1871066 RepID=UPI001AD0F0AA|nr:hypothetical protein [Mesorhizobium sp.]MBN9221536.1 hypothetical protein [Mesorhizobium sp.]